MQPDVTHMWNLKQFNSQKQKAKWCLPGPGTKMGRYWSKGTACQLEKRTKLWESIYSIETVVNVFLKIAKRVDFKCSNHKK